MTEGRRKCLEWLTEMLASQERSLLPSVHGSAHNRTLGKVFR